MCPLAFMSCYHRPGRVAHDRGVRREFVRVRIRRTLTGCGLMHRRRPAAPTAPSRASKPYPERSSAPARSRSASAATVRAVGAGGQGADPHALWSEHRCDGFRFRQPAAGRERHGGVSLCAHDEGGDCFDNTPVWAGGLKAGRKLNTRLRKDWRTARSPPAVMAGLVPAIAATPRLRKWLLPATSVPLQMAGTSVQPGDIADGCSETWLTVSFRV